MKIAIDVMGGDHAPNAMLAASELALAQRPDIELVLYGPQDTIKTFFQGKDTSRIHIEHAPDIITNSESPTLAIRRKSESSLVKAMDAVKRGDCEAVVSAGSTGAILAGGVFRVGRIRGIQRPSLGPVMPSTTSTPWLLIDAGANADCRADYLAQFALMGSAYMQAVMGVRTPRVHLLSVGEEAEKGNELIKQATPLLQSAPINFCGNIEARDVMAGITDVVVCDGFVGNVLLKSIEGTAGAMMSMLKEAFMSSTVSKLAALLLKPSLRTFKKKMDYREHGGAPLLGVDGVVIKAHGSSDAASFSYAILQAARSIDGQLVSTIKNKLHDVAPTERT